MLGGTGRGPRDGGMELFLRFSTWDSADKAQGMFPEIGIAPENFPSQKKNNLPTIHFQRAMSDFGGVSQGNSFPSKFLEHRELPPYASYF